MTIIDDQQPAEEEEVDLSNPDYRPQGRWNSLGVPGERSKDFKSALRRLGTMLGTSWVVVGIIFVLAVASAAFNVSGPKILGHATDLIVSGFYSHKGIDFTALHQTLFKALGVYAASAALSIAASFLLAGVIQRLMYKLRRAVEDKVNVLPLSYVDHQQRGDLLSRVTNDIDNVAQSLQQTLSQMLTSVLLLLGAAILMFTISPLLAVCALTTVPVSVWGMRVIARKARPRFMSQWRSTGELNAQIEETFTAHNVVKAFGRQHEVEERFRETNEELFESSFGAQFMSSLMQPLTMFMGNLQYVIVAIVGGLRVASGALSVGDIQAFIQYSRNFSMPLTQLASTINIFQSGIASFERVIEFLDADEQSAEPVDSAPLDNVRGRVEFNDVTFSYSPDRPLIEDLSLLAEPGQTVAIVGPTGAGKTTLVNLIMRFYELNGGSITLDGRDIASMPRRELRSKIGMVLQDTWLFGGSIRDNIMYGNMNATEEQMLEAARATYVDRFVHSLPMGYDTEINEEGDNISAGEKQLLTIARAFLANPAILILDEATSSVDTRTEVLIQEAMNALRKGRTSFVIAHRLSTIRGADIILVMEHGKIVEQGSHKDLLERDGPYARLYNSQFSGAAIEDIEEDGIPAGVYRPGSRGST
jgi:ATP-binding cassette subfamily B protein